MIKSAKELILRVYFILRLPLLFFIKLIFFIPRPAPEKIEKILIIRLDRIGDFVASLPVIDNLKLTYPKAELHVLVRPYLKELAERIKNIDQVSVYDNFIACASKLRKTRYDLAIDLLHDYKLKPAILAFLSAAPIRAGFAWGFRELLFSCFVKTSDRKAKSMVGVHLELLKALKVPIQVLTPYIETEKKKDSGQIVFGIHPGGHFPSQCWPKDKFVLLAKKILQQYQAKIYVLGSPQEKKLVSDIVSGIQDKNSEAVFVDTGRLVSLIAGCDLLICNNSGPLHLAAALKVATVSTMGPTDPELWFPEGEDNIVIRKELACSPCNRAYCFNHDCLNSIDVEEMEKAVALQISRIKQRNVR